MTAADPTVAFGGGPVVHHYSHATSISLELPAGYAVEGEDDTSATYVDDSTDPPVRVQTRLVARVDPGGLAKAVGALADGFADRPDATVRENRDTTIDGAWASTVVSRRVDGWTLHQTALAGQGELLSLVAMIPPGAPAGVLQGIDAAVESIRVIRL